MYKLCYHRFGDLQVRNSFLSSTHIPPPLQIRNAAEYFILPPINCVIKIFYGFFQLDFRTPSGFDRTRNVEIGNKNVKLTYLDEVFTTEHWLVRIYK